MATSLIELDNLLENIKDEYDKLKINEQNNWIRYIDNKMTEKERNEYKLKKKLDYLNFSESTYGKKKIEFLIKYLDSGPDIQNKFKINLLNLFNTGEFAVLAVRWGSEEILKFSFLALEQKIETKEDVRDSLTYLTFISASAKTMGLNESTLLIDYAKSSNSELVKNLVLSFVSRKPEDKTLWCMGYELINDDHFGYIFIGNDSDYNSKKHKQ